jgi:hypothetical protein
MSDAVADSIRAINSLSRPPAILAREPTERPDKLFRTIEAAKALKVNILELLHVEDRGELTADDAQTIRDTIDGELDIDGAIRFGLTKIREAEAHVASLKYEIAALRAREARFEKRIESFRGMILQTMVMIEERKREFDIATVSVLAAKPRVEIDQESEIPSQFFKVADPVLDKTALNKAALESHKAIEAVKAGSFESDEARDAALLRVFESMAPIPGCHVETGGATLMIRK